MLVFGVSVPSLPEQVLPSGTRRGLITGMDYRNGHLYESWSTFYLVFGESLVQESCGLSTVCSMWQPMSLLQYQHILLISISVHLCLAV